MRHNPVRRLAVLLCAGTAAFAVAACGTTEDTTDDEPTGSASAAVGPVTLTDARGKELTLDKPATKVVSLEWGLTEQVVSLGVMPVGVADVKGYRNWVTAADLDSSVKDVGTRGEPSADAVGGLGADLIVTTSDTAGSTITQLEKSAPVLVVKGNDVKGPVEYMKASTRLVAKALGKDTAAETLLARFDSAVAKARSALADDDLAGAPVVVSDGYQEGSAVSLRVFTRTSLWGDMLVKMGVTEPWTGKGDAAYGLAQTDVEGLTQLSKVTGDVHFLYIANKSDGGDVFADVLAKNPIWQGLPFVKADRVERLPDGTWSFGGPLSGVQFVERVTDALTD